MTTQALLHSFTIKTWADTKSNRRDRTYRVRAATADDALYEARMKALETIRHNVTVVAHIIDVDGRGAPVDCPHVEARLHAGFVLAPTGERLCGACQETNT